MSHSNRLPEITERLLKAIAVGLEKIEGHFASEGIAQDKSDGEEQASLGDLGSEGEDGDGPYEEPFYTAGFDREEIEIAA